VRLIQPFVNSHDDLRGAPRLTEARGPVTLTGSDRPCPKETTMAYKFIIKKDKAGEFRVNFVYNSETLFSTEGYASKASAKNAIESMKTNGPEAEIDDQTD
jgi:uncharacterized protein YegP (UPF0339 family)